MAGFAGAALMAAGLGMVAGGVIGLIVVLSPCPKCQCELCREGRRRD